MIGLKMEVFLSQPDILRLGEDTCLYDVDSSFALAKLFAIAKGGFSVTNQKLILNFVYSFVVVRLLLRSGELLRRGELKTSILHFLAS